ncbi:MAG: aminotransferase class I/II-fold pyridoxal phosphate-dependent enzyme, partial [Bacteroidia bacterium]
SIFLGHGKSQVLDLLLQAICKPETDNIVVFPPTETLYKKRAQIHGIEIREVPLTAVFQPDLDLLQEHVDAHTKIIFFCSPNKSTTNTIDREAIEIILNNFDGLVVVDEACINYSRHKSFIPDLADYANLVVLQTFSEAWNLAHLQVDMAFAWPDLIGVLNAIKPEYNINTPTQELLMEALEKINDVNAAIKETVRVREALRQELARCSVVKKVYSSDTNFILIEVMDALTVIEALQNAAVAALMYGEETCKNHIRIPVGTAEANALVIDVLMRFVA